LMAGMNIFNKIVVSNWEVVSDNVPDTPFKTLWSEVQFSEDYKALKAKVKRQYSRDRFYEWLRNNYKWNVIPDGTYVVEGIRKRYIQEEIIGGS